MIEGLRGITGWRIERRARPGGAARYRVGSVAIGVVLSTVFALAVSGADLSEFSNGLWNSTFGTSFGLQHTLSVTTGLFLTGLAAAIPLRIGLWNIGGDGQLFLGAWGAFAMGQLFPGMDGSLLIPLMFIAAAVCGAAWSIVPALARVYLSVNEIISTLMFNFIAASWVIYWAGTKWGEPKSAGSVKSVNVPAQSLLQSIQFGDYLIPIGFIVAVVLGAAVWLFLRGSVFGYEMTIIGSSPRAATYAGMPAERIILIVFALGGVAAGLAGVIEMLTNVQRYGPALSNNLGYTGVVVAVLAGGFGPELLVMAFVFAVIAVSGEVLSITGAPSELVFAMYGLTLICAAVGQGLRYLRIVSPTGRVGTEGPAPGVAGAAE
ncbi:MAG: ABC transporter permease [Solirubrobacterales bacterium]